MADLIALVRSSDPVEREEAMAALRILVPIVEGAPGDEDARRAVCRLIGRMPHDWLVTAVLDWWVVVKTGAPTPTGQAYRLPDEIDGSLRDAMEALLRLGTNTVPAATRLEAARELDEKIKGLDAALDLDHWGVAKLAGERTAWAALIGWAEPTVKALRAGRPAPRFEWEQGRLDHELADAGIHRNSPRWKKSHHHASKLTEYLNRCVELQSVVEPAGLPELPEPVDHVAEAILRELGPLAFVLRPVLAEHLATELGRTAPSVSEVVAGLEQQAATHNLNERFQLAMIADSWMRAERVQIPPLQNLLRRHEDLQQRLERLERAGVDTTEPGVALLDYELDRAEQWVRDAEERQQRVRRADSLRARLEALTHRQCDDPRMAEARDRLAEGDLERAAELVRDLEHAQDARERGDLLAFLGGVEEELKALEAAQSLLNELQHHRGEVESGGHPAGHAELRHHYEGVLQQLRTQRLAEAERLIEAAERVLESARSTELADEDAAHLTVLLDEVRDLLRAEQVTEGLLAARRLQQEIDRRRVHRWSAEEGEQSLVAHLREYCTQQLAFDELDILRLYVALKTKPFVILAGLTGSGKSTIARLFAEALGATTANGGFQRIAVRPDWIDQTEVLGHVNPLSNRFEPGWLAHVARDCERNPDRIFVVLLDEMNLAPVEQYLAEYLSALEEARTNAGAVRLPLYQRGQQPVNAGEWPDSLSFPRNLLVIGTINLDETTRAVSERVLDRANVIQLSVDVARDHHGAGSLEVRPWQVSFAAWQAICRQDPTDDHHEFLVELAGMFKDCEIGVGVRAHVELERFLANAEGILDPVDALDFGILQRFLPKVRGFKRDLADGLEELRDELGRVGAKRCVSVLERWLDDRVPDDEFLDGTDVRVGLAV
jgi:hypothetical protein